ncbi:MAG: aminodeoxychorismate synthase component I [Planctomycetaceae bacterium]|nr:aminodeoxychorismate synthase component I [Planctomycetaceae bacterium]
MTLSQALCVFERQPQLLVLHSGGAIRARDCRYTFLSADPIATVRLNSVQYGDDPFDVLRQWQMRLPNLRFSRVPPFCGGIAGLLSYELGHAFERLPEAARDPLGVPRMLAGLYDWSLVWDHVDGTVRLFVLSIPGEDDPDGSRRRTARIEWVQTMLSSTTDEAAQLPASPTSRANAVRLPEIRSDFTREAYVTAIRQVIEYIRAGDIFQANLSQQLQAPWEGTGTELFRRACLQNPAPFAGLLQADDFSVISASPERFLKVDQGRYVEARPIKGTRRRQQSPIADLFTADELSASEKDRAENVMIVDLLRNDLSRSCRPGSVRVTGVCEIEVFETVQHLVSTVVGELRADRDVWDLLQGAFPGGSITGAPKIRAMQIITELETTTRGAYCGSLFYCGPRGDFDSSILIRTFTLRNGLLHFPVGGGIVADSNAEEEYAETMHKASGMLKALRGNAAAS